MIISGPASSLANGSSTTAASISSSFEELQRELQAFSELFGLWTEQRRRALLEDKDAYLKTLSEEHGTTIVVDPIYMACRYCGGFEEAVPAAHPTKATDC